MWSFHFITTLGISEVVTVGVGCISIVIERLVHAHFWSIWKACLGTAEKFYFLVHLPVGATVICCGVLNVSCMPMFLWCSITLSYVVMCIVKSSSSAQFRCYFLCVWLC